MAWSSMPDTERGWYRKYDVKRTDGKYLGPCFVLELEDPKTWPALLTFAETVEAEGNVQLATDIRRRVLNEERIAALPDSYEGWQR